VTSLPSAREAITEDGKLATVTFRRWLESLGSTASVTAEAISAIATALGSPDGSVANIPDQDAGVSFVINGGGSVAVTGTLESGVFSITLANDSGNPGATYYYGTDATGAKGWHVLSTDGVPEGSTNLYFTNERARDATGAALVAGSGITITVDDPGDTITIAASSSGGGGEILVSDTNSAPPVMLTNEAEDDFIYSD
jgi:hypothetical protein